MSGEGVDIGKDEKEKWAERKNRRTPKKSGYLCKVENWGGQQNHERSPASTGGKTVRGTGAFASRGELEDSGTGYKLVGRWEIGVEAEKAFGEGTRRNRRQKGLRRKGRSRWTGRGPRGGAVAP